MTPSSLQRLLLAILLGLAVATPGVAAGKTVRVERYDVDATLDPTGTLNVEERVVFVLTGGPFTRVYRQIPLRFADGVTIVSALGDGQPLSDGAPSGLVQSRTPGELFVEWQFPPASDVTRTLVLRYRVTGAVGRGEDGDRLLWSPLPSRHDYGIDHSQVYVRWPALGVAPVAVSTRRDDGVRVAEHVQRDSVRFVAARIRRNDNYQVRIAFPAGSFAGDTPAWQELARARSQRTRAHALAGLAVLLVATLPLWLYWWQRRPQTRSTLPEAPSLSVPSSLPVALAAALKARSGQPPASAAWGTLMSLARQGFVAVDVPDAATPKHAAFRVQRLNAREPVHAHERQLLDHLFGMAAPARSGRTVDVTRATFAAGHPGFKKAVWDDLRKVGYIDEQRVSARRVLGRAGAVLAVAGGLGAAIAAVFGTTSDLGKTVALVPLGFVGAGGVAVILGAALTPLSERGLAEGVRWARMARGLSATVRSARRPAVDWTTVLPIATAFGLGAALARRSSELGVEIPAWFSRRPAERRSAAGADSWLMFLGSSVSSSDGSMSGGDGGSSAGADGGGGGGSGAD